jgi:hypothetical protein|tara:strand:- start:2676 stop:2852 length:177 start_codon:yes stop_codon:yes gene_type:complete
MKKNLKSTQVIDALTQKIELKKDLRVAKKEQDAVEIKQINKKIDKIEKKLHSIPLQKY